MLAELAGAGDREAADGHDLASLAQAQGDPLLALLRGGELGEELQLDRDGAGDDLLSVAAVVGLDEVLAGEGAVGRDARSLVGVELGVPLGYARRMAGMAGERL